MKCSHTLILTSADHCRHGPINDTISLSSIGTQWPEAIPIADMTANTVANALISSWISRFGVPLRVSTDQGRQFESTLFHELNHTLGTQHMRTSPYHPQANGLIERFHRTLKSALMSDKEPTKWATKLPIVLLGLRCAFKPDIGATAAELVHGSPLRLPKEFFSDSKSIPPSEFVAEHKQRMNEIRQVQTAHHSNAKPFVHPYLASCSHEFIRNDKIRPSLTAPYDGPFAAMERNSKTFKINVNNHRRTQISIDRLKPSHIETEGENVESTSKSVNSTSSSFNNLLLR